MNGIAEERVAPITGMRIDDSGSSFRGHNSGRSPWVVGRRRAGILVGTRLKQSWANRAACSSFVQLFSLHRRYDLLRLPGRCLEDYPVGADEERARRPPMTPVVSSIGRAAPIPFLRDNYTFSRGHYHWQASRRTVCMLFARSLSSSAQSIES